MNPVNAASRAAGRRRSDLAADAGPTAYQLRRGAAKAPHELRLIGGQWKRSKLPVLDKPGLRPTPDRVRETLFNWLGHDLSGWRCLDAFAGSGALGFEAASRGAAEVLLLERDADLVNSLRASQQRLQASLLQVEQADALAWMARCAPQRFDLVLLDPPFGAGLQPTALAVAAPLVAPGGSLYLESPANLTAAELPADFAIWRAARAGLVHYHLLRRNG